MAERTVPPRKHWSNSKPSASCPTHMGGHYRGPAMRSSTASAPSVMTVTRKVVCYCQYRRREWFPWRSRKRIPRQAAHGMTAPGQTPLTTKPSSRRRPWAVSGVATSCFSGHVMWSRDSIVFSPPQETTPLLPHSHGGAASDHQRVEKGCERL